MKRGAWISACGTYRYELTREWEAERPMVHFIMLNPSTADGNQDDPTIRRCIGFAKCWGFGGLAVTNLSPLRATNPRELKDHQCDGFAWRANRASIARWHNDAPLTVLAWGANEAVTKDGSLNKYTYGLGIDWDAAACLGMTKGGYPRHPLYVKGDTPPIPWVTEVARVWYKGERLTEDGDE